MELIRLKEGILAAFDVRYLRSWQEHFMLCSSKRVVWDILIGAGIIDRGLSTFYHELRSQQLPTYLRRIATVAAIPLILVLLEVSDPELIEQVRAFEEQAGIDHQDLLTSR